MKKKQGVSRTNTGAKETAKNHKVTLEDVRSALTWVEGTVDGIPPTVRACLLAVLGAALALESNVRSATATLKKIMMTGKINPPSEKGSGRPKLPSSACDKQIRKAKYAICANIRLLERLTSTLRPAPPEDFSTGCPTAPGGKQPTEVVTPAAEEMSDMSAAVPEHLKDLEGIDAILAINDINDQDENVAAIDKLMAKQLALGQGADHSPDKNLPHAREELFGAGQATHSKRDLRFGFSPDELSTLKKGMSGMARVSSHASTRFDFSFSVGSWAIESDVLRDPATDTVISAQPETIGLKGYQVTLRSMVNLVVLTVGFLMPMHRIARLLGNMPIFHRSNIGRYLGVVAERAVPVYLELLRGLANASHLSADASPTRVNEVDRLFEKRRQSLAEGKTPDPFPWETAELQDVADPDEGVPGDGIPESPPSVIQASEQCDSAQPLPPDHVETSGPDGGTQQENQSSRIARRLFPILGYDFTQRKGTTCRTPRHQTVVLHGFTHHADRESYVVVFRSLLGDVGNVLDKVLLDRRQNTTLTLQCDHSTANLPRDPAILKRVNLVTAGCLAHLRRPFKRHFDQDPERCEQILNMMVNITFTESELKRVGRNPENTLAMRQSWSAVALEALHHLISENCRLPTWSDQTPLGKAGRSFLRHFKKLLPFLSDPRLEATNNASERLLRPEKLAQGSSYFRDTIEGRARYDILRSLCQTCAGIELSFAVYLMHLLLAEPTLIERNPSSFTPLSVKRFLQANPIENQRILLALQRGY